ncbi:AI-2E family transporter [Arsenicitalea aurantiaca]|nr:AI-2E family transporter [Arsenicitalea aurantiaca]
MMTLRNHVAIWIGFFVVSILLLWVFRSILLPFVVGLALAYLLNPLVNLLQRIRISRGWASALALFSVLSIILGLILSFMPLVISQAIGLVQRLPGYVTDLQALARSYAPQLNEWLGPERAAQLEQTLGELTANLLGFVGSLTAGIAASGLGLINTLAFIIVAPVVAFYMLLDWEGMVRGLDDLLPREQRTEIRGVIDQIDRSMAGVIRGQGGVILVLCIYYASALSLVGLNFGLAIGLIAGLFSFVPFVGFAIGFVLSVGVGIVQFWPDWVMVAIVFAIFLVGQFLEGNILYPKLVGSSININPVWLMFALFAFGLLFGFVGLLLAVPLAAIAGVLTRYAISKYKGSTLYLGRTDDEVAVAAAAATMGEVAPTPPAPRPRAGRRTRGAT